MVKQTCPHTDQLASFVRCELSEEVAANVLDHLDSCPHCEETVAKLEHTIKSVLPGVAATMIDMPYADESACQRAVQSLLREFAAPIPDTEPGSKTKPIPAPDAPTEFQTLRDFRIIEKVGQGGMGAVYKAVHQRMQRTVALKVLPSAMIGDQSAVARFSREMSVLGQLNHPNIVQAFDAGEHDGQHYLAMEFIEGQDLASVLRKQGRLSVANACLIVSQVATALQYAHEKGFVHRDIKPSNLMLAETVGADGNRQAIVKVLDLGLARVFEQRASADVGESGELTSAGQIMGTLDYMAPEQGSDSHQVDIRTDIYSLGATFYKFLTGEAPFAEHAGKAPMQRLMAIATLDARPITSRCPDAPEKLAKVVHRMLEKDPARRFQTPAEVLKAIGEFTTGACLIELLQPDIGSKIEPTKLAPSIEIKGHGGNGKRFSKSFLASMGGFAAFIALSALLVVTTRHGRVEVTSPEGQLPEDLRIVVLKGGEEVQVLQSDNQWTARLVNGEYDVELRGGDDQFEIEDSKLVVTRLGKAICVVTHTAAPQGSDGPADSSYPPRKFDPLERASKEAPPSKLTSRDPSSQIPDREMPFVLVDESGKVLQEFRYAGEALAIPQKGILEVHGNGPFRLSEVRRDGGSLHIRAGQGYRPKFVVGFELPEGMNGVHWFRLINTNLTIEGCDFYGESSDQFLSFFGTGGRWKFDNCRLMNPPTRVGVIVRFNGESFTSLNSLWFTSSNSSIIADLQATPSVQLKGNFLLAATVAVAMGSAAQQLLWLEDNEFFGSCLLLLAKDESSGELLQIEARGNHFYNRDTLISSNSNGDPKKLATWTGENNRILALGTYPLWVIGKPEDPQPLTSPAEWNAYWGNATDLESMPSKSFGWDLLNNSGIDAARTEIAAEITNARNKFPNLPDVGPDIKLVGPGKAWDDVLQNAYPANSESIAGPPEGGPFVITREGISLDGYTSFTSALEHTQDDDIIEVRSNGVFPAVHIGYHFNRRVTLRAAYGYRPAFEYFYADEKAGHWTLEGLHFHSLSGGPSILCAAKRVANCSIGSSTVDGRAILRCPSGAESVEIVNCFFCEDTQIQSPSAKILNSVLSTVAIGPRQGDPDLTKPTIEVKHSCLWSHSTPPLPNGGTAVTAVGNLSQHISDSLIDAANVSYGVWSGERNLYRTFGQIESKPVTDEGSTRDDSAFLRMTMWQRK